MSNVSVTPALFHPNFLQSYLQGPTAVSGADPGASFPITPDALMAYCQSRLDSIDGQMRDSFSTQERRVREGQDLQGVLSLLNASANGTESMDVCHNMETKLRAQIDAIEKSDPGFPGLGKLKQTYNNLVYTGTGPRGPSGMPYYDGYPPNLSGSDHEGDGKINSAEMTELISGLQGAINDLNSGAELQMIGLQSLMSQRQTAVQLTTNLVQALGDQANKIAQNIGH